MTDAAPTHLDLDQLADALAGEPHEHLAGCASCTSRLGELQAAEAGVVAALRALPDPPVPAELADRLSAAFAAGSPLAAARSSVTALPAQAPRRRFLPAAAAAVLLVSGAGLGYALVTGSTSGDDIAASGDSAAGLAAGRDLVQNASGADYADPASVSAALPAVLAGTARAAESMDSTAMRAQPESEDQADSSAELPAPAAAAVPEDPLARLRDPAGLQDCLTAVLPPEEPDLRPRALDYATYQGQPALAVVLPDPEPGKLSVFVVGPDCAAADAKVLSFLRVDAP